MKQNTRVAEIQISNTPAIAEKPIITGSLDAYNVENPETLTIKIRSRLITKWIDNQLVSWSMKTGNAWSKGPDYPHTKNECLCHHKTVIRRTKPPIFCRCC